MGFKEYAKRFITEALEKTPVDVRSDIYVVSLFVYDQEDDPRRPAVTVGYNAEARAADAVSDAQDAGEARWNYAFWLQNDLGVLGDAERDLEGTKLREAWLKDQDLWVTDEALDSDDDDEFDAAMEVGEQMTSRYVELMVQIVQELHADGLVTRIFDRPIPVLVHELEYYEEVAEQNVRANPDGLADEFARWVMDA